MVLVILLFIFVSRNSNTYRI